MRKRPLCLAALVSSILYIVWKQNGRMATETLDYFHRRKRIEGLDASEVTWSHAVNSRGKLAEALAGPAHMLEADVVMRGHDPREPIMAHPPESDSDITLREWLRGVKAHDKGVKLDFKSLDAVPASLVALEEALAGDPRPVWVNADVLEGPGGRATPLEPGAFLAATATLPDHVVLSLGWTTGWTAGTQNPGYSWSVVREMERICAPLKHRVTFPVRAALLDQSLDQLSWLLQQSDRYTLTVWTGAQDQLRAQELLPYRRLLDLSRIYYDLPDVLLQQLRETPGPQDGPSGSNGSSGPPTGQN